jgi:hypothetical protein
MDLRDLPGLERLCAHLTEVLPRLDVIINNACQTVRRPPAYYKHLLQAEAAGAKEYLAAAATKTPVLGLLAGVGHAGGEGGRGGGGGGGGGGDGVDVSGGGGSGGSGGGEGSPGGDADGVKGGAASGGEIQTEGGGGWRRGDVGTLQGAGWMAPSAAASQLELLLSDVADAATTSANFPTVGTLYVQVEFSCPIAPGLVSESAWFGVSTLGPEMRYPGFKIRFQRVNLCRYPAGVLDVNGQQVDLREKHSWTMKLGEVGLHSLPGVRLITQTIPAVINWMCFDCTPGCQIVYTDNTGCDQLVF